MGNTHYGDDVAYIHETGFSGYIDGCAPGLLAFLESAGVRDGLVVDVGCGGGRWAQRLVQSGYQVLGIDVSASMVALARQRVPSATFEVASVWKYQYPRCRAVTGVGEVLCYRSDSSSSARKLGKLLGKLYRALSPGGLLIFDVAEIGLDRGRKQAFSQGDDWACLTAFEYDEHRDRLTRHVTTFRQVGGDSFRRSQEKHVLQLYDAGEVAEQLRRTGFRVRRVRKFGEQSLLRRRVGFIARKP